jgi:7,8-dihydropterin-6-yl-methyl-4-(beta-D-ribofuranosyl)aminobenzene 5'-phosphate synthase
MTTAESGHCDLAEVDAIEIFSLMDNTVDFLSSTEKEGVQSFRQWIKKLHGTQWAEAHSQLPFAEHGFSMFIRAFREKKQVSILFDTGVSEGGVGENAKRMGLNLQEVQYVILSHGHYDHFGGLVSALKTINKTHLPLIVHEDMFRKRGNTDADGTIRAYPEFPAKEQLTSTHLISTTKPYLIGDGAILVTGEIPRETSFEKGFSRHMFLENAVWQPDPLILDDRALIFNVKGKGLVVISGCAHAGIINTINYAQKITGVSTVYAVIGGFHLVGKNNGPRIEQTVKKLQQMNPKRIIPSHCTGWTGTIAIANALPDGFINSSVGNRYVL